jgi:DNA-binding transcriptional ArsR family regulator
MERSGIARAKPLLAGPDSEPVTDAPLMMPVDLMHTVCDENRLTILRALSRSSQDVSSLAELLELDGSHVSYHLRKLRDYKLVQRDRQKTRRLYRLSSNIEVECTAVAVSLGVRTDACPGLHIYLVR